MRDKCLSNNVIPLTIKKKLEAFAHEENADDKSMQVAISTAVSKCNSLINENNTFHK